MPSGLVMDDGSADHRHRVVVAVYVMLLRPGPPRRTHDMVRRGPAQILLQLRQNTGFMDGMWACGAAGHVEAGESVPAAAVRELREELGVDASMADLQPVTVMHRAVHGGPAVDQRMDVFFVLEKWQGQPSVQELDKVADLQWFSLDALPTAVVPHERRVMDALLSPTDFTMRPVRTIDRLMVEESWL